MADPISVITLAASIIATCYDYGCTAANAPAEAQKLASEVSNLSAVLVGIQGLWKEHQLELGRLNLPAALADCEIYLNSVKAQLDAHIPRAGRTKGERLLGRLTWPLKRSETLELLQIIERQKSTMNLILVSFTSHTVGDNQREIQQIFESVKNLNSVASAGEESKQNQEILDWLCDYKHQVVHDNACQKHCDNTSAWLLEHPTFVEWRNSVGSLLWLSGLPGSGKTMLVSYVIEHLLHMSTDKDTTVIFFYFDKSTNQSLSVRTFIASLLRQLCSQHGIPQAIKDIFVASRLPTGGLKEPNLAQLGSMYSAMDLLNPQVTLVVDGVDEADDPDAVCETIEWIMNISDRFVNCFMSSRPLQNPSIVDHCLTMTLSAENISSDISTYIENRFSTEYRLRKMKPELKAYIKQELLVQASGMFRLAQCQLDEISKLRTNASVKGALMTLPRTLETSYDRFLDRVDEDDLVFARRILLWLAYALYPLHLSSVAEAAVFEPGMSIIEDDTRLSDPRDILDICGMLVSHNIILDEIRLAHHTVREYLSLKPGSRVYLPEAKSHRDMAELCLSYLLMQPFTAPYDSLEELLLALHDYPLLAYAARSWPNHVLLSGAEDELQPIISRLMTPEASPRFLLWLQILLWHSSHGFEIPGTSTPNQPTPLYYASSYGLYHTVRSLIAAGADLNVCAGQYGGTAYHAACWRKHPEIISLLLEAGADTEIRDYNDMTGVELTGFIGLGDGMVKTALEPGQGGNGANPLDKALKAMYHLQQAQDRARRSGGLRMHTLHKSSRKRPPFQQRELHKSAPSGLE